MRHHSILRLLTASIVLAASGFAYAMSDFEPAQTQPFRVAVQMEQDRRASIDDFARRQGIDRAEMRRRFGATGLVRCGAAVGTAQLTLRYRKPTPLGVPLRFEGWQTRVAGRRIHAAGRLLAGDLVTAEAEGVFVELSGGRVLRMLDPEEPTSS